MKEPLIKKKKFKNFKNIFHPYIVILFNAAKLYKVCQIKK